MNNIIIDRFYNELSKFVFYIRVVVSLLFVDVKGWCLVILRNSFLSNLDNCQMDVPKGCIQNTPLFPYTYYVRVSVSYSYLCNTYMSKNVLFLVFLYMYDPKIVAKSPDSIRSSCIFFFSFRGSFFSHFLFSCMLT